MLTPPSHKIIQNTFLEMLHRVALDTNGLFTEASSLVSGEREQRATVTLLLASVATAWLQTSGLAFI